MVAACTDVTLPVYRVAAVAAAMITATEGPLGVPMPVRNLVLPMAVSIFRITSAAANFAVAIYLAALHGITIGLGLFLVGMLVATVVSLAAVGLPSQVSFFTTIGPVCLAIGVTVELLPAARRQDDFRHLPHGGQRDGRCRLDDIASLAGIGC
ncbi:hypothetical protein AB5I41_09640 [Sphingomonas sp. MMS24-JH45]